MDKTRTRVVEMCTPSHLNHTVAFHMSIDTHASIIFFLIETCINYYTLDTMFNGFNWSKTSLNFIINNKFCAILTVCSCTILFLTVYLYSASFVIPNMNFGIKGKLMRSHPQHMSLPITHLFHCFADSRWQKRVQSSVWFVLLMVLFIYF